MNDWDADIQDLEMQVTIARTNLIRAEGTLGWVRGKKQEEADAAHEDGTVEATEVGDAAESPKDSSRQKGSRKGSN